MSIKKFEDKSLNPGKGVTEKGKSAIIETKEIEFCYPTIGKTIYAKSKGEADQKIKNLLN
jgi:hypothetical protein